MSDSETIKWIKDHPIDGCIITGIIGFTIGILTGVGLSL